MYSIPSAVNLQVFLRLTKYFFFDISRLLAGPGGCSDRGDLDALLGGALGGLLLGAHLGDQLFDLAEERRALLIVQGCVEDDTEFVQRHGLSFRPSAPASRREQGTRHAWRNRNSRPNAGKSKPTSTPYGARARACAPRTAKRGRPLRRTEGSRRRTPTHRSSRQRSATLSTQQYEPSRQVMRGSLPMRS